jgi:hypothetical protein
VAWGPVGLRAVAIGAAALSLTVLVPRAVTAAVKGTGASSQQSIGTAVWAGVATVNPPAAGATGALALSIPLAGGPQYIWVTNTGTVNLGAALVTVAYSISASGLGIGYLQLRACTGAGATWNESLNLCIGGTVQVLTSSTTAAGGGNIAVPAAPGSAIRLQVNPVGVSIAATASISVAVTRT